MHPQVEHVEAEAVRVELDDPEEEARAADEEEEEEPPPDDQEHLVVDDVQGEDADGVDGLLTPARAVSDRF